MFHRFFIWRAQKRLAHSRFRFDRRHYRHHFGPGFFQTSHGVNFFEVDEDPMRKFRRNRRRFWILLIVLGTAFATWFFIESMAFLEVF